ncbi:MAG: bacteriohemerythrin [Actinomycetota bacterium]
MPIAQWTDELKTGVFEIDNQHKEIIKMINDFHEALSKGKGKEVVENTIRFLSDYVVKHFKTEEKMMLDYHYPAFPAHKREHDNFTAEFADLVKEYNKDSNASFIAITIQRSVVSWLVNHIMKVDKAMAKFLLDKSGGKVA